MTACTKISGEGHVWKYTSTGAVTKGDLLLIGATPAVALESADAAAAGHTIAVETGGEWLMPKKAAASTAITVGGRVYIVSDTTYKASGVAAAGKLLGFGLEAATTAATTCKVAMNSGVPPLETQA